MGVRSLQTKRKSRSVFDVLVWQTIKSLSAFYIATLVSQAHLCITQRCAPSSNHSVADAGNFRSCLVLINAVGSAAAD